MTTPAKQPEPTPRPEAPSIQAAVRADLEIREQIGIETYGTHLTAHNGRDALRDAYEEALDQALYLRQAIAERDNLPDPNAETNPGRSFAAPFDQLITNFHSFGKWWSWRCGLLTGTHEQYQAVCRYDHATDQGRDVAVREATEHLIHVHGIYPLTAGAE